MSTQTKRTHKGIVSVAKRGALTVVDVPTVSPGAHEVLVKVDWAGTGPVDLHRNDGGALIDAYPYVLGSVAVGKVVEVGAEVKHLAVGDQVVSYGWKSQQERGQQEYVTVHEHIVGKVPSNVSPESVVSVPENAVTVFHSLVTHGGLEFPHPKPEGWIPPYAQTPIVIWSAATGVGQYALQILKYWGYNKIIATASSKHHEFLKTLAPKGTTFFDYRSEDVVEKVRETLAAMPSSEAPIFYDCIGAKDTSLAAVSRIAEAKATVVVLLPVILTQATESVEPEYSLDPSEPRVATWKEGVKVAGVRTHAYLENKQHAETLQPVVIPHLLAEKVLEPNRVRVVEGATVLERAQNALDALRRGDVSGEKLVWRVSEIN